MLQRFSNLVISRSFSKAYGLAGYRVGFAVSSIEIADYLNRVRQPFNANSLALHAAEIALGDEKFIQKCLELNHEQKQILLQSWDPWVMNACRAEGTLFRLIVRRIRKMHLINCYWRELL